MNIANLIASLSIAFLILHGASGSVAEDMGPDRRLVRILKTGPAGIKQFNRWRLLNPVEEVNFRGADLRGVNFRGADLRLADFSNAKLQGAVFGLNLADELAKAEECRRSFAAREQRSGGLKAAQENILLGIMATTKCENAFGILAKTQVSAANLQGANFKGAELDGADFTGAKGCDKVRNAPSGFYARCVNPKVRQSK